MTRARMAPGGCYLKYDRAAGTIKLLDDAGSTWLGPVVLGAASLSNGQCALGATGSAASASGNSLTLNLALTFTAGFTGKQNIYMEARDQGGLDTGMQQRGTYLVDACSGVDLIASRNVVRAAGNDVWAYAQDDGSCSGGFTVTGRELGGIQSSAIGPWTKQ